jgi:hypothetical protein
MNIRNPKHSVNGWIDCELEHPELGWIPHTASPDDPETQQTYARILNGEAGAIAPADPVDLDAMRSAKLAEINRQSAIEAGALISAYPEFERLTWPDQEREARAWQADNAAETPTLDAIATARGLTLADLAGRVITKADTFRLAAGQLAGKRQALEDQIGAAVTQAEIEAITW